MPIGRTVHYEGECWEYVHLNSDAIKEEEEIMYEVLDMYHKGQDKRNVKGKTFEGRLTAGKFSCLGSLVGQIFNGEIDSNEVGRLNLSILLLNKVNASLN